MGDNAALDIVNELLLLKSLVLGYMTVTVKSNILLLSPTMLTDTWSVHYMQLLCPHFL